MTSRAAAALRVCVCACAFSACGTGGPHLEQPVGETHTTSSSTGGARREGEDAAALSVRVVVGAEVRRACDMPEAPREAFGEAPEFAFESGRLRALGDDILQRVASCLTSGKLDAANLRVIGFADPRSTDEYAYRLGTYRGAAGKQHLVDHGVPAKRLIVESRGNQDAKGNDEPTWSLDRRVEVHVMDAGPPPVIERNVP